MSSEAPLLDVVDVAKAFGELKVLTGVRLQVRPGEAVGLVGPNGSGKTTLLNVISGLYPPDAGRIVFSGIPIAGLPAHRIRRLGIARTFQVPRPFRSLSVRENVVVANAHLPPPGPDPDEVLAFVGLAGLALRPAHSLNAAQQKLLDLARAVVGAPRLLLVDELAAGLGPGDLEAVAERLGELRRRGVALLVVEHLLPFLRRIVDRVVVLDAGEVLFEGTLEAAARNPSVVEAFLGTVGGEIGV